MDENKPSDFQSWNDYLDLNGEQEQQLMQRAVDEANASQEQANKALNRGMEEARAAQLREARGGNVATTTLSSTGSYQDYLRLKTQANEQYSRAMLGGDAVSSNARARMAASSGVASEWVRRGDQLQQRAEQLAKRSTEGAAGATRIAGEQKKAKDDAAAADAARRADDARRFDAAKAAAMERYHTQRDTLDKQATSFDFDGKPMVLYGERGFNDETANRWRADGSFFGFGDEVSKDLDTPQLYSFGRIVKKGT